MAHTHIQGGHMGNEKILSKMLCFAGQDKKILSGFNQKYGLSY